MRQRIQSTLTDERSDSTRLDVCEAVESTNAEFCSSAPRSGEGVVHLQNRNALGVSILDVGLRAGVTSLRSSFELPRPLQALGACRLQYAGPGVAECLDALVQTGSVSGRPIRQAHGDAYRPAPTVSGTMHVSDHMPLINDDVVVLHVRPPKLRIEGNGFHEQDV